MYTRCGNESNMEAVIKKALSKDGAIKMYNQTTEEISSYTVETGEKYLVLIEGRYNRYKTIYSGATIDGEFAVASDYNTTGNLKAFLVTATSVTLKLKADSSNWSAGVTTVIKVSEIYALIKKALSKNVIKMYNQNANAVDYIATETGEKYLVMVTGAYNKYKMIYKNCGIVDGEFFIESDYNTTGLLKAFLVTATSTTIGLKSSNESDPGAGTTTIIKLS